MTLAAETRDAVRDRPYLLDALRAGVVNYAAAARTLDVEGDQDAIAAALRRFAEELGAPERETRSARVRMVRLEGDDGLPLPIEDGNAVPDAGSWTAIVAEGDVDAGALERVLGLLRVEEIGVAAAGVADGSLAVVVRRRASADALKLIEAGLESDPL